MIFNISVLLMLLGIGLYRYILIHQLRLMMRYDILPVMRIKWKVEFVLKYVYPCVAIVVIVNSLIK